MNPTNQLRDPLLIITRRAGPLPGIQFRFLHPVADILGVYARPAATRAIAPRPVPVLSHTSKTIAAARSHSSAACPSVMP